MLDYWEGMKNRCHSYRRTHGKVLWLESGESGGFIGQKKEFASGIPIQKRQSYQFRSIFGMEFMVVIVYFWVKMQKKISFVLKVCVWSRLLTKFKLLRCSMCKIDKVCAKVSSWRNMQFFAERCERMKSVWSCHFGIKTMCWPSVFWDKNRHE